ncbi:MAG: hypothetical protein WKG07_24425 [Hymenobacter sp.]
MGHRGCLRPAPRKHTAGSSCTRWPTGRGRCRELDVVVSAEPASSGFCTSPGFAASTFASTPTGGRGLTARRAPNHNLYQLPYASHPASASASRLRHPRFSSRRPQYRRRKPLLREVLVATDGNRRAAARAARQCGYSVEVKGDDRRATA